eukprot:TRINITY_DN22817_c0_g1_i1.p3 TRINITY_DN22817_c0_g1~~TRINITY_DN22817_c0_g1_i1.p3  ORF type:complete len:177 (+),score=41.73 TRINITY_DN22817_c0_g1_i1:107-637(+)
MCIRDRYMGLINSMEEKRRQSMIQETQIKSETANPLALSFNKSIIRKKRIVSMDVSITSIAEAISDLDDAAAAARIQSWYKRILLRDRSNFNAKDLYDIVQRFNAKVSVEYNDCLGEVKEEHIRILFVRKKNTETTELIAVSKKTNKRYRPIFALHQTSNATLKTIGAQVNFRLTQ